ncbi:DUF805 domain-containing protein [Demequina zhanjiangensis]|uniref:DUF805 domain-containing protein n=1 Tax=Demequina zhanjiangensis TaxID=3051659 RepID=A0ABT8G4B5_9MICO|nr:DUF805 domain-containing protein [Demequina sp. SYSU T00b26]MDN4473857.1 DUF805 domain-containing protein [Demequina sp. SYSU T00b26]
MGFGQAVKVCFSKYAVFSGRARRAEFWWFFLFQQVVGIVLSIIFTVLYFASLGPAFAQIEADGTIPDSALEDINWAPMTIGIVIASVVSLALLLPSLAVTVRRLHDTGRSGWWYLISFIPFGGIVVLVFAALESESGTNQYGPDPKAGDRWSGMPAAPVYPGAPVAQGAMPSYPGAQPTQPQPGAIQQPAPAAPQAPAQTPPPAAPPAQSAPPAAPSPDAGGTDDPFAQPPR